MTPPVKSATPYGGRLTWKLPGGNLLIVHLKDKKKVIKRKRWSMVVCFSFLIRFNKLVINKKNVNKGHVHVLSTRLSSFRSM